VADARSIRRREDGPLSHVRRFDHVGLTVADLDVVTAFFVALGLEVDGRMFVEGEFLDTVLDGITLSDEEGHRENARGAAVVHVRRGLVSADRVRAD
jgi:catechol 2,3-dioxygenase-like lactoylglutathione lyase family enzyme